MNCLSIDRQPQSWSTADVIQRHTAVLTNWKYNAVCNIQLKYNTIAIKNVQVAE